MNRAFFKNKILSADLSQEQIKKKEKSRRPSEDIV